MFSDQRPGSKVFLQEATAGAEAWHHGHAPALPCFLGGHTLSATARNTGAVDQAEITSEESCPPALMLLLSSCWMLAETAVGARLLELRHLFGWWSLCILCADARHALSWLILQPPCHNSFVVLILQKRKLRLRKARCLPQDTQELRLRQG